MFEATFIAVSLLCPLADEDPHFQSYRIMGIEGTVYDMEQYVDQIEPEWVRERFRTDIQIIRYNLGEGNMYQ